MLQKVLWVVLVLAGVTLHAQTITLTGTKGEKTTDQQLIRDKTTVLFFLSPECPLCQSYSLTIKELAETFSSKGIQMVGIVPGTDYSDLEISTFKHKYKLPIDLWKDENLLLTRKYHATITPEAIVIDKNGKVVYQGRIDNWAYELSKKRKVITEHDLKNALNSVVNGKPVAVPRTKAIGCFIE